MDLFNPPKPFNYNIMIKDLDFSKFDNPTIQVVWEDQQENFTQDKIKSVKHYFQKKYNTTNVNILTKVKNVDQETEQTIDVSLNVTDTNYQTDLLKSHLKNVGNEEYLEKVLELNQIVENKMQENNVDTTQFKKWYIRNIEFSNFLSYGENQRLDFDKIDGLIVVESNPPNFGGKTVLTVDLLMFLFFNETTKTSKAEEVFNRFSNKDEVNVKGEITIDGEDYIIVRKIERKKTRKGAWNVKTELDFFKKLSDGSLQNFTGEQRRETEAFIKNSIGTKEDFLMTILTTSTNLEELLESKPTARGQILSRFMGLEFLKTKEETGKEIYSEFNKSKLSNVYNSEELKTGIQDYKNDIIDYDTIIKECEDDLLEIEKNIKKGKSYRDEMLSKKHMDIDNEILTLNPEKTKEKIIELNGEKETIVTKLKDLNVVEPSEFYYEDKHDEIKEEYNKVNKELIQLETKIEDVEKLKTSVEGGIKCEHCGIELMNAAITNAKIAELDGLNQQKLKINDLMLDLSNKGDKFTKLKKEFDEYEKNKLIKEKYDLSIEGYDLKIENLETKLKRWDEIQDKVATNKKIDEMLIKADLRLDQLDSLKTTNNTKITTNKKNIENTYEKIKNNENLITKIKEEDEKDRIYKIYLELYGKNGISKTIMKTMMPLINSELQRLMEDSSYFKLEIRISEKNEVEFVMIDNDTGIEKLMVSGSGYEKTIASLALRAVLSKVCSLPKPNVVVFDEVFGKISNENLEMVAEFFIKIKDYFDKIFIITHNPIVNQWADHIVRIKKENNLSKIVE